MEDGIDKRPMDFALKRPCKDCPFLRQSNYLSASRAEEVANYVLRDEKTFSCHKTVHSDREKLSMCAGALIAAHKTNANNYILRFARGVGLYNPDELDLTADVYESADEMRKGHTRS